MTLSIFLRAYWPSVYLLWRNIYSSHLPIFFACFSNTFYWSITCIGKKCASHKWRVRWIFTKWIHSYNQKPSLPLPLTQGWPPSWLPLGWLLIAKISFADFCLKSTNYTLLCLPSVVQQQIHLSFCIKLQFVHSLGYAVFYCMNLQQFFQSTVTDTWNVCRFWLLLIVDILMHVFCLIFFGCLIFSTWDIIDA